ncbi:MAG: hypothetical protein JWR68_53 [Polaromonas sp.]|nr:hypothetical protein [Polaromonas sp.]
MKRLFLALSVSCTALLLSGCPDAKVPSPTPKVPEPKAQVLRPDSLPQVALGMASEPAAGSEYS